MSTRKKNDNATNLDSRPGLRSSRRVFLGRSLAAAGGLAFPQIIPASALGRDGSVAPSERIVLAGIGLGSRGTYDLTVMLPEKDVQFVAICDVQRTQREAIKKMVDEHYGNDDCVMYRDIFELLDRPDIDAVLIATGDHWHALASILAMKAGKDVYSEKPCAMTIAEAQALADAAHRYARVFQAGTQRRSLANFQYAAYLAHSGKLGTTPHPPRLGLHPEPDLRVAAGRAGAAIEEVDWDRWLGPCPWRPYNHEYVKGWRGHYDFEAAANFSTGAPTPSTSASGPTRPTTPCPSSARPTRRRSPAATPTGSS